MKHFVISVDLFDVNVFVMVDFKEADLRRHFRKDPKLPLLCQAIINWDDEDEGGRACFLGGAPIILLRSKGRNHSNFVGTIAHEMMHAGFEILRGHGVKYSHDSEEVYCYLTGYLVQETLRRIRGRS